MEFAYREFLISRICAGLFKFKYQEKNLFIKQPTRLQRYISNEIYHEVFIDCLEDGLYDNLSLNKFMYTKGFWDNEREDLLNKLPKEIENFKVALYESKFRSDQKETIRRCLSIAKNKHEELVSEKNKYNYLSAAGTALAAKMKYIIGISLYRSNEKPVYTDDDFWQSDDPLLDFAVSEYYSSRISEPMFREIARTEPWKSYFNVKACEGGVFQNAVVDLTDEQRILLAWSSLYNNIAEHPECPPDRIVNDDDCIDGWLILQRRKRLSDIEQQEGESLLENEKIRNSEEVYIMAGSREDADRIEEMNSDLGKAIKEVRMRKLREKGHVEQLDMPDVRQRMIAEFNNMRSR